MVLRAGELRTPLMIQSPVETRQADGHMKVTAYTDVIQWWAGRVGAAGSEVVAAMARHGSRTVVWRGRFMPSHPVTTKHVLYDRTANIRYDIQSAVDPDGRRTELVITATERDA